jgi:hypothetical protein
MVSERGSNERAEVEEEEEEVLYNNSEGVGVLRDDISG